MRRALVLALCSGCAAGSAGSAGSAAAPFAAPPASAPLAAPSPVVTATRAAALSCPVVETASTASTAYAFADTSSATLDAIELDDELGDEPGELGARTSSAGVPPIWFTRELSDEALAERWKSAPAELGPIAVGFAHEGRLINALPFPCDGGDAWTVVEPSTTWGTQETIDAVVAAAKRVKALHPSALPLRVNSISGKEGGHLRPHRSHQNGRDVDLGFYYPTPSPTGGRAKEKVMELGPNWELLKSLLITGDVEFVLLDRRVQKVLYDFALAKGEDKAWLDSIFLGRDAIVQHARGHRDHFHVRYYSPRAQELGRRVAPLLALRPEHNRLSYHVRNGDNLGAIARRYGTTIAAIQKANRMRGTFLRVRQVLQIPLRGPCTQCPVPSPFAVPPRRVPPEPVIVDVGTVTATVSAL